MTTAAPPPISGSSICSIEASNAPETARPIGSRASRRSFAPSVTILLARPSMRHGHALGPAGGARGVDHVGGVLRVERERGSRRSVVVRSHPPRRRGARVARPAPQADPPAPTASPAPARPHRPACRTAGPPDTQDRAADTRRPPSRSPAHRSPSRASARRTDPTTTSGPTPSARRRCASWFARWSSSR